MVGNRLDAGWPQGGRQGQKRDRHPARILRLHLFLGHARVNASYLESRRLGRVGRMLQRWSNALLALREII